MRGKRKQHGKREAGLRSDGELWVLQFWVNRSRILFLCCWCLSTVNIQPSKLNLTGCAVLILPLGNCLQLNNSKKIYELTPVLCAHSSQQSGSAELK